jgi:predicted AlkP superfamily pyrophosphatase or phosphodiesterase
MNKTIFVIIDGCRPDGLQKASTPHIQSLIGRGAYTFCARTVNPPISWPAILSIFTSLKPINHGVLTNTGRPDPSSAACSLIDLAKYGGRRSAAFFSWDLLVNIYGPGSLEYSVCSSSAAREDNDLIIAEVAADYILKAQPDFAFIYLERTDWVGHVCGYMSESYLAAVQTADQAVGLLLESLIKAELMDQYTILIQSDHGGSGYHHMDVSVPEIMTIPWIVAGPAVRRGYTIIGEVTVLDTAPTIARLLNIRPHHTWEGKVVEEIFKPKP